MAAMSQHLMDYDPALAPHCDPGNSTMFQCVRTAVFKCKRSHDVAVQSSFDGLSVFDLFDTWMPAK